MTRLNALRWFLSTREGGWLVHSLRTAAGTAASLAVARLFGMPEAYWAAITTLIVMQSTLGAAWAVSKQRFIGTALGSALGGLLATYIQPGLLVFGAALFALGLVCAMLHLDRSAYRFAGITLAIVMLVARGDASWRIAVHRFVEVSLGIAVALVLTAAWPGRELVGPDGRRSP